MTKTNKIKNNFMGETLYQNFDNLLKENRTWLEQEQLERKGSRLVIQSPYVTTSFKEIGFDLEEKALGMNVFRPNIKMEDYAVVSGNISKITLTTSEARAQVTAEKILEYPTVRMQMRKFGIRERHVYEAVKDAAIREMMQVSFIGALDLGEKANEAAAFAVINRVASKNGKFREMLELAGVDWEWDVRGVAQFSEEIDFEDFVQTAYATDPYYNRRADIADCARFESTRGSIDLVDMTKMSMVDRLLNHFVGKSKSMEPWMKRAVMRRLA